LEQGPRERPQRPRTLNADVDPDLEAICLKALEKSPTARYPSAAALADDLERYLAREPVAARPAAGGNAAGAGSASILLVRRSVWRARPPPLGLLTVIAVQSLELREETRKTRIGSHGSGRPPPRHGRPPRPKPSVTGENGRGPPPRREALYIADIRLADAARQVGDSMQLTQLLDRQVPGRGEEDVRGFEWFVLDRTGRVPCTRLKTAFEPVGCVAYSPDGRRIAAAGEGGRIQVFHAQTHAEEISLATEHRNVRDLAFAPDGSCWRRLATMVR